MASPFCWYELMTTDTAAAGDFYAKVVGWDLEAGQGDMAFYTSFKTPGGVMIGGMMGIDDEMAAQGMRPGWIGYVAVDDLEASTAKVAELGGTVHRPPSDIPGVGRFSVVADPFGAAFQLFHGAQDFTMPADGKGTGFIAWRELMAGDLEKAWTFYSELLGWTSDTDHDMGPMGPYRLFKTGGADNAGGMMTKPADLPASFWTYYFSVEGVRAAAERIAMHGGIVINGPMQVPGGDWIVQATDPQGAMFALHSTTE
jgi:predicted enzyme related to lactoylglutathione lyase